MANNMQRPAPQDTTQHPTTPTDESIDGTLQELIKKQRHRFEKALRIERTTQDRLTKTRDEIKALREDTSKYPPGVRAFRQPTAGDELQEVYSSCIEADFNLPQTLPKGTTRAQALEMTYRHCQIIQKQIWEEYLNARITTLNEVTTREHFDSSCKTIEGEFTEDKNAHLPSNAPRYLTPSAALKKLVDEQYGKAIEHVQEESRKLELQKQRDMKKQEAEKKEALVKNPANILERVIDKRIEKKTVSLLGSERPDDRMEDDDDDAYISSDDANLNEFVDAIGSSKNAASPGAAQGHNTTGKGRASVPWSYWHQSHGKGKDASRKGKGKGKNSAKLKDAVDNQKGQSKSSKGKSSKGKQKGKGKKGKSKRK